MDVAVREVGAEALALYSTIPTSFTVKSILRVEALQGGLGGLRLVEEAMAEPYVKDYGESGEEGERPVHWQERFDVSSWGFFLAYAAPAGDAPTGGAAVAFNTAGVNMLEERDDLAVLWDIRVHPGYRGRGVGETLFRHAARWARERGCRQLKVETQNVNVDACRFYAAMGCELGAIHRYAYAGNPAVAHEAMLLWYLEL